MLLVYEQGLNTEPFEKPWSSPVPPLTESIDKTVLYPADEEDNGMHYFFWRGPRATDEQYK
jgi:hypothetical protein